MENLLLLFNSSLPCWDFETVLTAGENPSGLEFLVKSGDLMKISDAYVLTPKGVKTRENVGKELFLPPTPAGEIIIDEARAKEMLELNRMTQFLDRVFFTDWGIKEISIREKFPIMPSLNDDEYFVFENNKNLFSQ